MHVAPWSPAQVRLVVGCNAGAAALVAVSATAAGGASLQDQVAWLNVAVLAMLLTVVANGCLFLVARRAIGRRRLSLVPDVQGHVHERPDHPTATGDWFWVPGTTRAHRLGCPMTAARAPRPVSDAVIRAERLRRCEICG